MTTQDDMDVIVGADGPLSVQCGKCKAWIGGTTYPKTEVTTDDIWTMLIGHAPNCRPPGVSC